jgi:hydrogenase nickel incorporation protein HypA/HybF
VHEYSLVEALVRRVEDEAQRRSATAVHRVTVSVGELAGVEPELFRTAYETFRDGTVCEGVALDLVVRAAAWSCPSCGRAFARGDVLHCRACDRPARLAEHGDALVLESIEMEVP